MILAFSIIESPFLLQLYSEDDFSKNENIDFYIQKKEGLLVAEKNIPEGVGRKRADLLSEISDFLVSQNIQPQKIRKIFFVHGPGKFTAVRTACVVVNTFANQLNIPLFPIHGKMYKNNNTTEKLASFSSKKNGFQKIISEYNLGKLQLDEKKFVEPLYNAPPRIC